MIAFMIETDLFFSEKFQEDRVICAQVSIMMSAVIKMYIPGTKDSSSAADRSERVTGVNIALYSDNCIQCIDEIPTSAFCRIAHSANNKDLYGTCVDDLCMH